MEHWKKYHHETEAENKKMLLRLSKLASKTINARADQIHHEVFRKIHCLDCAHCCKSIPPMVNRTDSRRIAKFMKMSLSSFENQYLTQDDDGDQVMKLSPCPFLQPDHYCSIYEVRPKACRDYPHTDGQQFTKNLRLHVQNSHYCPAVFHILENLKKAF